MLRSHRAVLGSEVAERSLSTPTLLLPAFGFGFWRRVRQPLAVHIALSFTPCTVLARAEHDVHFAVAAAVLGDARLLRHILEKRRWAK